MATTNEPSIPDYITRAIASERRPDRDTARDAGRRPAEVLAFLGVKPGQRVAELNGGWGYFSGLLSEVVGDTGKVYAHTTEASMKRWGGNPIAKRIEKYAIGNIEPVIGTMDAPGLPAGLDAVFMIMTYHDAVWSGANRPAMNQAIFTALKPGGTLGIIDHHARPGRGIDDCHGLHRIEKQVVIDEITAAGFELAAESDALAHPEDPCTEEIHQKHIRDLTHRFVLRFRKPG